MRSGKRVCRDGKEYGLEGREHGESMERYQALGLVWVGVGEGGARGDCQTIGSCREILFMCT